MVEILIAVWVLGIVAWVVVMTMRDNPRNAGVGALIMLAGVPVSVVWRRLFRRTPS